LSIAAERDLKNRLQFVGKLRLTQGLDFKSDDDNQSDKSIREKINEILARIPEEFVLEENLTEILKLVLDQELQVSFKFQTHHRGRRSIYKNIDFYVSL
jgi:hypothetical protein